MSSSRPPRRRQRPAALDQLLADAMVWRHDPTQLPIATTFAEQGYADAQYLLGLIYIEGRGTPPDPVQACYWLSRAVAQGDRDATLLLQVAQQELNHEQRIALEQQLANDAKEDQQLH